MTDTTRAGPRAGTDWQAWQAWQAWQDSWDRLQEWYVPDREERFRVMPDMAEALVGTSPGCWIWRAVREVSRIGSSSGSRTPRARASISTRRSFLI